MGVPLSDVCFRKHQRMAQLNILGPNSKLDSQFRFFDKHVLDVLLQACRFHFEDYMSEAACERFLAEEKQNHQTPNHNLVEGPNSKLDSQFRFFDKHVLDVLLQACRFHFEDYMSEAACERFLAEEKQ
ncbi:hypothetical protein MJO29_010932, partial [Puccinia striiformis f. sp. tritici]